MTDIPGLPARPRLRPGIEVVPVERDKVLLRSFSGSVMLSGEFVASHLHDVLALLNGRNTVHDLIAGMQEGARPELNELLALLLQKGLLSDGEAASPGREDAYWSLYETVPGDAARRLQAATVIIVGLGGVGRTVARLLAMAGVGRLVLLDPNSVRSSDVSLGCNAVHVGRPIVNALAAELAAHRAELVPMIGSVDEVPDWDRVVADASLIILANDDMSLAGYDRVNQACLEHETPWVSARIDRSRGIIGPFVVPKQTACFTCFELRSRVNAEFPQDHEALHRHWKGCGESPDTWPMIAPFVEMVGACVALDAQRVLGAKALSAFLGRILHWDLHGFESRFHELLKLPRCPACSRARERPLEKIWDLRPAARG